MLGSVYIETTIPSYYYETRRSPQITAWREATKKWWADYRAQYDVFTSAYVIAELNRAPARKASRAKKLLSDVPVLEDLPGMRDVVTYYIEHQLMPGDALGDAAHLAFASMHGMKFLLRWNCRHLANAN